jgi:hypothetical protein
MRIDQRIAHAGLGGQMHHGGETVFGKERRHAGAVGEIEFRETEAFELGQLREARILQRRIVIGVEIVEADDGAAGFQQPPRDVKADETGGAGDEDGVTRHWSPPRCAQKGASL